MGVADTGAMERLAGLGILGFFAKYACCAWCVTVTEVKYINYMRKYLVLVRKKAGFHTDLRFLLIRSCSSRVSCREVALCDGDGRMHS